MPNAYKIQIPDTCRLIIDRLQKTDFKLMPLAAVSVTVSSDAYRTIGTLQQTQSPNKHFLFSPISS